MDTPAATLRHKELRSVTSPDAAKWVFGDAETRVKDFDTFADKRAGYDPETAYLMAVVSAWAYSDADVLASKLRYYGLDGARIRQISVVNNALLVVATGYLILSASGRVGILAFRGTDPASLVTWLADAELTQRSFCGGKVHSGFFGNIQAVWEDTARALSCARKSEFIEQGTSDRTRKNTKLDEPLRALYITGHSLGGAMAVLAAARLFRDDFADWDPKNFVRGVYTFGQPMVGDADFAEFVTSKFGKKLFRHVYRGDVVPHLPPESDFDYRHVGSERRAYWVDQSWAPVKESAERAEAVTAVFSSIATAIEQRLAPDLRIGEYSIDDHMPANYVDVSRNLAKGKPAVEDAKSPFEEVAEGVEKAAGGVGQILEGVTRVGQGAAATVDLAARAVQQTVVGVVEKLPNLPGILKLPAKLPWLG